jgi:hypothetical protein
VMFFCIFIFVVNWYQYHISRILWRRKHKVIWVMYFCIIGIVFLINSLALILFCCV